MTPRAAQETIFSFLLSIVKEWEAEEVLNQFRQLFFEYGETASDEVSSAIYVLLFTNDEIEFYNTLNAHATFLSITGKWHGVINLFKHLWIYLMMRI